MSRTALILSGGGARGAFQAGAEKILREEGGYSWDILAGVSVGALNATMLALGRAERIWEIWQTIEAKDVYTGGFTPWSVLKVLFGAKSFYGNEPLQRLIARELSGHLVDPAKVLRIGAVSLMTGDYVTFTGHEPYFARGLLASTAVPIIWSPVDVSEALPEMVDGGVRNTSPLGDTLEFDPNEIVVINCFSRTIDRIDKRPGNIEQVGRRSTEIMLNEILVEDVKEFILINALVKQAEAHGIVLYHPETGRALRHVELTLIEPTVPLGDGLDFSRPAIDHSLAHGIEMARRLLRTRRV